MRRIIMEKSREIIRLSLETGLSQREISQAVGCSLGQVNTVLTRVKEAGVEAPLALDTKSLLSIIYPASPAPTKAEPDLAWIDKEMKRKEVTLFILWEEYREKNPEGLMYTQFCSRYRDYRKRNNVYMRKIYKAGEQMLVDWAGVTLPFSENGKNQTAKFFVAVLPASNYLYTEPFRDMKTDAWVDAHIHAFEYFGGVPRLLVPDNAKTAVIKASRHDPELNKTYAELADYYGAVIVPARPLKPTDKAPAETGVQIVERRIIAKFRHTQFLSFDELQSAVASELEVLNTQPFQKLPGTRRSVFLEMEKGMLMHLPPLRYEKAYWKKAKAGFDYHVALDKNHYYSVPYRYAGLIVDVRATAHTVEVFYEGERIASHVLSITDRRYTTNPDHMPEAHKAVAAWSSERFISWAARTGPASSAYIAALLDSRELPEQCYRTCAGILRLAASRNAKVIEAVCEKALASRQFTYRAFNALLENYEEAAPVSPAMPVVHENIRGSAYFAGEGQNDAK
jgi:transposase